VTSLEVLKSSSGDGDIEAGGGETLQMGGDISSLSEDDMRLRADAADWNPTALQPANGSDQSIDLGAGPAEAVAVDAHQCGTHNSPRAALSCAGPGSAVPRLGYIRTCAHAASNRLDVPSACWGVFFQPGCTAVGSGHLDPGAGSKLRVLARAAAVPTHVALEENNRANASHSLAGTNRNSPQSVVVVRGVGSRGISDRSKERT